MVSDHLFLWALFVDVCGVCVFCFLYLFFLLSLFLLLSAYLFIFEECKGVELGGM